MRKMLLAVAVLALPAMGYAAPYYYVDWTAASAAGGSASGTITLPDASVVNVTFQSITAAGGPGTFAFGQTSGGTDYWTPRNASSPYISAQVDNPPPDSDIIALEGGTNQTYRVTLSEPIKDPIMGIVSLGRAGVPTTYDFDSPFEIVSQGVGFFGGGAGALVELPGDILQGSEGHGTIQFIGTFSTFSWTVPTPEFWHGFTFGIRTTTAIEPGPVPEPGTLALVAGVLGALGWLGRRRVRS